MNGYTFNYSLCSILQSSRYSKSYASCKKFLDKVNFKLRSKHVDYENEAGRSGSGLKKPEQATIEHY